MKKVFFTAILLTAGIVTLSAQQVVYSFIGWTPWGSLQIRNAGDGIVVSGTTSSNSGIAIETRNPGLGGRNRIILEISGITETDDFDVGKLVKLEINNVARSDTGGNMNRNDPEYLNARNGEYIFDISALRDIRKIELVFHKCTVKSLRIDMFVE